MGRRKKHQITNIHTEDSESINIANSLRSMAECVNSAEHIKESTIQAAGLREIARPYQLMEVDDGA